MLQPQPTTPPAARLTQEKPILSEKCTVSSDVHSPVGSGDHSVQGTSSGSISMDGSHRSRSVAQSGSTFDGIAAFNYYAIGDCAVTDAAYQSSPVEAKTKSVLGISLWSKHWHGSS